jgi:hypothetical protein
MNWGKGITLIYIGFVILIGSMVYITTQQKFDLVSEDYYDQEIKFQDKINAAANAAALGSKVEFLLTANELIITMPDQLNMNTLKGNLLCYNSSDSKHDITFNLKPDETGKQIISREKFSHCQYILKLSFQDEGKSFYVEKEMKF